MITRLDHIMIAVRDLDTAIEHYQHLGFHVTSRGTQQALGTHNAIIFLGFAYIELISTFNPGLTMQRMPDVDTILNILDQRDGAVIAFALTSTNMQQDIEKLADTDLVVTPPYTIVTDRTDGPPLNIQVFMPGNSLWRSSWPLLYQWETTEARRSSTSHVHANGATGMTRLSVGVKNLSKTRDLYQRKFGLVLQQQDKLARLGAYRARFQAGNSYIDLITPQEKGALQNDLSELGDGVFEIFLTVNDLKQSCAFLKQQGIEYTMNVAGPDTLMIALHETFGIRCIFTQ